MYEGLREERGEVTRLEAVQTIAGASVEVCYPLERLVSESEKSFSTASYRFWTSSEGGYVTPRRLNARNAYVFAVSEKRAILAM
jgi:hypothetical protein